MLTEKELSQANLTSYSERKFIKYLLQVQDAINKVSIEEDTLKFTSKYVARGMGLVIGEQNRPSIFYVYPNTGTNKIDNVLVNIKGPYNTFGGHIISNSETQTNNVNTMIKIRKENLKEQQKLEYKSRAQRSFFRSVSFDIGPIMNLVTNRRNSGEIAVKVEMEKERAKITFLPKFSGIYELLLTSDGQHLQGSPYVIRIMKSNQEIEDILQGRIKTNRSVIERKIIGKCIDFVSESVSITEGHPFKFDSNNNPNAKDSVESNRSDDESVYQDSGIFDLSDQLSNRSKPRDLEEIDEDARLSEISDLNAMDESKHNSLEYKAENENYLEDNVNSVVELNSENKENVIVHNYMPDDIKFLTEDYKEFHLLRPESSEELTDEVKVLENDLLEDGSSNQTVEKVEEEVLDSENEFENLYNKIAKDEEPAPPPEDPHPVEDLKSQNDVDQNLSSTDFEILSNIPQFQKGKKITASIEKIVEIFEKDSANKTNKIEIQQQITYLKYDLNCASPVLPNIEQEAIIPDELPAGDSAHLLEKDEQLSTMEEGPVSQKIDSICLNDDETKIGDVKNIEGEVYDTNVRNIRNIFEKKDEVKIPNRRFATTWKRQNGLQETKNKLAKSMPNLSCANNTKNSMEDSFVEDEFLLKFKEKRNFWKNLVQQNSNGNLNASTPEISLNNTRLISKHYEMTSQSVSALNTLPKTNKSSLSNKLKRQKEELCKTVSLDLTPSFDVEFKTQDRTTKITRSESLYDRIRIFDKGRINQNKIILKLKLKFSDFDFSKHTLVLKRTKERSDLKERSKHQILKPDSLTEVPNTTSTDQIEEDLRFAEIMKERFEISRRFFCSLENVDGKPNLSRRHSMDSKPHEKEHPLQKGGSLKNVMETFSLDNVYKDVILSKMKNSSFKGSPNHDALVETLSSVSSGETDGDKEKKDFAEEEEDLNLQFFNIRKRLRKRRSIKSIFDVNY